MRHLRSVLLIVLLVSMMSGFAPEYAGIVSAGDEEKKVEEEYQPLELGGMKAVEEFWNCINNEKKIADKLTLPEDTYKISKRVEVGKTGALEIEAGSKFLFSNGSGIDCRGKFIAKGTKEKQITFTADENSTWANIALFYKSTKGSKLQYCIISKGSGYENFSEVVNEKVSFGGGVVIAEEAEVNISNCTIEKNSADYGGGIQVSNSKATLVDCTIQENTSGLLEEPAKPKKYDFIRYGGSGIYCTNSEIEIKSSKLINNTALYSADFGGFCSFDSKVKLKDLVSINKSMEKKFGRDVSIIFNYREATDLVLKNVKVDTKEYSSFLLITNNKKIRKEKHDFEDLQTKPGEKNNDELQTQPQTQTKPNEDEEILKESEKKFWDLINNGKAIDEKLTLPAKTYEISKEIDVSENGELKLLPGTKFYFSEKVGFSCRGTLTAIGTLKEPIKFTSMDDVFWKGLQIRGEKSAQTKLTHCIISRSTMGVTCKDKADVTLSDCIIEKNEYRYRSGLSILSASVTVTNCRIQFNKSNDLSGVFIKQSNSKFINCYIGDNESIDNCGLYIEESKNILFDNCDIRNNTAVNGFNVISYDSNIEFSNCRIQKNYVGLEEEEDWGFGAHFFGGGQILLKSSDVKFIKTLITNNNAGWSSKSSPQALIEVSNGKILIKDSKIYNNKCSGNVRSKFLYIYYTEPSDIDITIENSVLDDNDQSLNEIKKIGT